jgi:DNA mismatch repair protein MutL
VNKNGETNESIIQKLPPKVSNKIAAGEVIQRPSSVIKELLDNAIDAGSSHIKVIVQNAGRTLLQVIDNGSGMGREDIKLCFQQHATSKIKNVEDLFRVRTLGFRGEAMASIASVSQVELKSKRPGDEAGFSYEIWGGEEKSSIEPTSVKGGTSVAVRNLFYNVPARRQFLKTDATEFRHILKTVQQTALAHPDIGFQLIADMDEIYDLAGDQPLKERISSMFGKNYKASLLSFSEDTSYVNVSGILADPKLTKRSRGEQFLFVNGRPIQHRYLIHIILNIYETWINERDYPFFALFIDIDPSLVDVNVHPAKEEVKFEDERSIIKLVKSVVKRTLNEHFLVPEVPEDENVIGARRGNHFPSNFSFQAGPQAKGGSSRTTKFPSQINRQSRSRPEGNGKQWAETLYSSNIDESNDQSREDIDDSLVQEPNRGFWQLHNSYVLTQTKSGLCLVDQFAAHKRILYEKALQATQASLPNTQQLLFAQTIELSATEFSLLEELHSIIQQMGFNVQLLSGNTAMINGVPADVDIDDEQSVLRSMLHQYRQLDAKMELDARHKLAVAYASKTAIPHGKRLSEAEMENLLDQLFACDEPFSDPLNKSTIVYLSQKDIQAYFR